jgi:hypothetical protein
MKMIGIGVVLVVLGFAGGTIFSGGIDHSGSFPRQADSMAKECESRADLTQFNCKEFGFHFLTEYDLQMTADSRRIQIFMDASAFNEKNLSELFMFISKEAPEESLLTVVVNTDWSQLEFPRPNCPGKASSRTGKRAAHQRAVFYRRKGVEYFRYRDSKENWTERTVILKGDGTGIRR